MTNNINNNDLYIILSSIQSSNVEELQEKKSVIGLRNLAVETKNIDALINLLEIDGNYYFSDGEVKTLVDEKILENPESARVIHLKAHKQAIEYGKKRWGYAETDYVRVSVRIKNQKAKEIAQIDKEISQYDEKSYAPLLESLDEKKGRRALKLKEYYKHSNWLKGTQCEALYKKAMLAYDAEAKDLTPAQAQVNYAKAHLINVAYAYGEQLQYQANQLQEASASVNSVELQYYNIMCGMADKRLNFEQSVASLEKIAGQNLYSEDEIAVSLSEDSIGNSSADEMAE